MGLSDWLFGATPGQQAGQAVKEVIGSVFEGIDGIIDDFNWAPDEKAKFKVAMAESKLKAVQMAMDNVGSARAMQMATRSVWPGWMSAFAVGGFFGGFFSLLFIGLPTGVDEMTKTIINMFAGAMIASYKDALNFWLGSTNSSQTKDQYIYNSTPVTKKDP
jgi:hypothetical protein